MITGETKNKVDAVWQKMWEGGITNPLEVISQLTYLMFMQRLDEREYENERMEELSGSSVEHIFPKEYTNPQGETIPGEQIRWSRFKDLEAEEMHRVVSQFAFPFIQSFGNENALARGMQDATFGIRSPKTLQRAVDGVDELLSQYLDGADDLGDLYEYMLSKLNSAGANGQFRTPQHIRDLMVKLVDPKPGQYICDPACGTAGFLISASKHIRECYSGKANSVDWEFFSGELKSVDARKKYDGAQFTGFDTDQTMLRISAMNLMLHGITAPEVRYMDSVSKGNTIGSRYDVILANPPFTGSVDAEGIDDGLKAIVDTKQTELLFVALFLRMLKLGGRCACIVPNGVLFRTNSKAYRQLREELVEHQRLEAIIYMPSGVFKPYSGVSTAVLVFTKTDSGGTDDVWLYNMEGDGYTLDDKRDPDPAHDDIPDILERWDNLEAEKARARTDKSFLVPREEIAENDYDFSFNKYTETVYERKEYPPTDEILADLADINERIAKGLDELKAMLAEDVRDE